VASGCARVATSLARDDGGSHFTIFGRDYAAEQAVAARANATLSAAGSILRNEGARSSESAAILLAKELRCGEIAATDGPLAAVILPMPRASLPNRPTTQLVRRAQNALGMSHRRFGTALGASERTALRWRAGKSAVSVAQLHTLARLVHPRDPQLAGELAEAGSETLASLGIVPAPVAPPLAPRVLADVVTCAAADAIGLAPSAARKALAAAFERARELGATAADVESALAAPTAPPPPPPRQSPPSA
jgi:hypothetical protein